MTRKHNSELRLKKHQFCILFLVASTLTGCSKAASKLGMMSGPGSLSDDDKFKNIVAATEARLHTKNNIWHSFNSELDDTFKMIEVMHVFDIREFPYWNCYASLREIENDFVTKEPQFKDLVKPISDKLRECMTLLYQIVMIQRAHDYHDTLRIICARVTRACVNKDGDLHSTQGSSAMPCADNMRFSTELDSLYKGMHLQFVDFLNHIGRLIEQFMDVRNISNKRFPCSDDLSLIALFMDANNSDDLKTLETLKTTKKACLIRFNYIRDQMINHKVYRLFQGELNNAGPINAKNAKVVSDTIFQVQQLLQDKIKQACVSLEKSKRAFTDLALSYPLFDQLLSQAGPYKELLEKFYNNHIISRPEGPMIADGACRLYIVEHLYKVWDHLHNHFGKVMEMSTDPQRRASVVDLEPSTSQRANVKEEQYQQILEHSILHSTLLTPIMVKRELVTVCGDDSDTGSDPSMSSPVRCRSSFNPHFHEPDEPERSEFPSIREYPLTAEEVREGLGGEGLGGEGLGGEGLGGEGLGGEGLGGEGLRREEALEARFEEALEARFEKQIFRVESRQASQDSSYHPGKSISKQRSPVASQKKRGRGRGRGAKS